MDKRCLCCLAGGRLVGKLCGACYTFEIRRSREKEHRAKDPFGAIRNGEGKGISKITLPLLTVVIRKHNGHESRFIKIRMGGESGRRWMPFARWWWEKNQGPVPPGHLVLHKDGDLLNDDPKNLMTGTAGMKLKLAHERDHGWSRDQHKRAAAGCSERNRRVGRLNRAHRFLKNYWYPVNDDLGVILNVPFKKRKRMLACFQVDVSKYPANGRGKNPGSMVQRALRSCRVRPVKSVDLGFRRYSTYCLIDPVSSECSGPLSMSVGQLTRQLDYMGVWAPAQKQAKRDLSERNSYARKA